VLGGPPNSGKSTLLNALVARDAAIVSEIAGTTRDLIEVPVALEGIPLIFIDTAGLRDETGDRIETMGIERTRSAMADADMILWLGDEGQGPDHCQTIEIEAKVDERQHPVKDGRAFRVSAQSGEGMGLLTAEIVARAKTLLPPADQFAANQRQRGLLADCAGALSAVSTLTDWLMVAEHLRQARLALDALTGRAHTEDMLDMLFGRFCVGK
jgi:tRNA modification GTPase